MQNLTWRASFTLFQEVLPVPKAFPLFQKVNTMIQAIIFDLDGTLVQTEKLKAISYAKAAVTLRPDIEVEGVIDSFREVVGRSRHEVAQYIVNRFDLRDAATARIGEFSVNTPWQAYIQIRLKIYDEMLKDPNVLLTNQWPHNIALLKRARASCSHVGLATMSYCPQVQRVLSILDLQDAFDFVASRDDVELGKPDPEIYLLVANQLKVPPSECLVIEDSPTGVQAALNAGMACIAVSTSFTQKALNEGNLLEDRWIVNDPTNLFDVFEQMIEEQHVR